MRYKKINTFRFFLTKEECGRDDVEVTVEYRADQSQPQRGNCFVDYWLNLKDYGFRSHMNGIWLTVTKENVVEKIKLHMLPGIKQQIKMYERFIGVLEEQDFLWEDEDE
jgi:hypothetical protein